MVLDAGIDNYIFDLYGTLIDIRTDEWAAATWKKWYKCLRKRGLRLPPYYTFRKDFFDLDRRKREEAGAYGKYKAVEIDIIPVYRELFEGYGNGTLSDEVLNEVAYEFRVSSRIYAKLFPGVEESLRQISAAGKHPYILSNAQRSYTWPEITMFGLDKLTEDQLISSDFGCMKPEKAFFDILLDRYNMDRDRSCMHGDSESSDIDGAKAAGIRYVHLTGENHPNVFYMKDSCNRT